MVCVRRWVTILIVAHEDLGWYRNMRSVIFESDVGRRRMERRSVARSRGRKDGKLLKGTEARLKCMESWSHTS
jgi:hypothetical protein